MTETSGFTLLEVVIAMLILAFLSLFTVEAIQRALSTKAKIQTEIDRNANVRDALRIMERDINMAFNYRDISIQLYNMAQDQRIKAGTATTSGVGTGTTSSGVGGPNQPFNPNDPKYAKKTEKVYTQFMGGPQEMAFTTLSNVRMMEDSQISNQAEIAYFLKACRRRSNQEASSNCLWRRVANYLHEDVTKDYGQSTVLLENVKEFKLRYLGPGRDGEWVDTWKTGEGADDASRGKFPWAVEITIEVKEANKPGEKEKSLRMTTVAGIRNPNNPVDPVTGQDLNGNQNPQNPQAPGAPPPLAPPPGAGPGAGPGGRPQ